MTNGLQGQVKKSFEQSFEKLLERASREILIERHRAVTGVDDQVSTLNMGPNIKAEYRGRQ